MTEQPITSPTEQEWLGHRRPAEDEAPRIVTSIQSGPTAQRVSPPKLTPPTPLHSASVVSMSRPYEVAQANVLLRKTITAAAKLQLARRASEQAEEAMKEALARENLAEIDSANADKALLDFTREVADQ